MHIHDHMHTRKITSRSLLLIVPAVIHGSNVPRVRAVILFALAMSLVVQRSAYRVKVDRRRALFVFLCGTLGCRLFFACIQLRA